MVALLIAGALGLFVSLVGTRFLIDWLAAHGVGQPIHEDVPETHVTKAGTPTMGGVVIVAGAVIGYAAAHIRSGAIFTRTGLLVLLAIAGAGFVGLVDDWIKVSRERNLGLNKTTKMVGLLAVAVTFSVLAAFHTPIHTELSFTRWDSLDLDLSRTGWVLVAILFIVGTSNAVNLTDGLDGLAAGSANYAFTAFTIIAFWGFRHPEVYALPHALDVAMVAAAMLGACSGFLWWNANPARIIMGDTGSLAIGTGLAAMAVTTSTHMLLPVIGGLYVLETMSVILQVGSFRLFKRRIFRMAPIHHHFEIGGWPENTVIVRFWILSALCTALALGLYYADFVSVSGVD